MRRRLHLVSLSNCWCPKYSNQVQKDLTPLTAQRIVALKPKGFSKMFSLFVLFGAYCCVQGKIVHASLMAFETSTTKNLFMWMEVTVSSLKNIWRPELCPTICSLQARFQKNICLNVLSYCFGSNREANRDDSSTKHAT
nr:hypothetical protein CFP56_15126 [Quercus suber]